MANFMALSPNRAINRKLGLLRGGNRLRSGNNIRGVGNKLQPSILAAPINKPKTPLISSDTGLPIRQPMLPTVRRR